MTRRPEPVGLGFARHQAWESEAFWMIGGRWSTHKTTKWGVSSWSIVILAISNVFWIKLGMTRVSGEIWVKLS